MFHLVYCDDKEKVLEKILDGSKTMIVRGAAGRKVLADNQEKLNLSEKQKERWNKKCLCFIEFEKVQPIEPLLFDHQGNMDDWLIIDKIEDVVVGTSIPYNYDRSRC